SFNSFGGLSSLNGFDGFFGEGHFCSASTVQVFSKEEIVTCHATDITVIQQQLSIVAEYAKRVILTQSCETETQVVAFSQWLAGLVSFGEDLRRVSERHVSFDASIASQISSVVDASGNINIGDFGFSGSEIGSHSVTVIGGNWNDQTSPISVGLAWDSCVAAAGVSTLAASSAIDAQEQFAAHLYRFLLRGLLQRQHRQPSASNLFGLLWPRLRQLVAPADHLWLPARPRLHPAACRLLRLLWL
ncbi:hypothetical protein AURDEDRAFT_59425, partial [Auricularia subglabra TFB-10046 SS5]